MYMEIFLKEYSKQVITGALLGVIVTVTFFFSYGQRETEAMNVLEVPKVLGEQVVDLDFGEQPTELQQVNILLLGYGGAGHEGGMLTDVIQVLHFDVHKENIALISIPRDLWVDLPDGKSGKVNRAYSFDGAGDSADSVKQMVQLVTGLPIDYFIAVDFVGFQRLIGYELQGIEVQVAEPLSDDWYPIKGEELNTCGKTADEIAQLTRELSGFELERQFACRYEKLFFPKGSVHMEGGDALKYVRSRHGSGAGDFSRSRRQHEVLEAIKKKLFSLDAVRLAPDLYEAYVQHVSTDLTLDIVKYLQPALLNVDSLSVQSVVVSTDSVLEQARSTTGQFILQPKHDWAAVREYIAEEIE